MAGYVTNNPRELKDAILRRLGAPIIKVDVTTDQIYDCIQRSLELYGEYHYDGLHKGYLAFYVGDDEVYKNGTFDIKDNRVFAVSQIIRTNVGSITSMDGNATYPWFTDFLMGMAGINGGMGSSCKKSYGPNAFGADLGYFTQIMTYWTMMQDLISPLPDFWYNEANGLLKVMGNFRPKDVIVVEVWIKSYIDVPDMVGSTAGYTLAGGCATSGATPSERYMNPYSALDGQTAGGQPNTQQGSYNNRWVKDMATAMVKELWGEILFKHQGLQLPGGTTVDGLTLKMEAREKQDQLREELELLDPPFGILVG